ncbi:unnamed protein product, partial [Rotaria magnacalcarata]
RNSSIIFDSDDDPDTATIGDVDVQNKLLETNYSTPIGEDASKPRATAKTNIEMMDLTTPKTSPVGLYQPNYLP